MRAYHYEPHMMSNRYARFWQDIYHLGVLYDVRVGDNVPAVVIEKTRPRAASKLTGLVSL